jgi:hypothetical protein
MPTRYCPELPSFDQRWAIQGQRHYCRSTDRSEANDVPAAERPGEMIPPHLMPWIEEPYDLTGRIIDDGYPVGLVAIAQGAGQPEICLVGCPTKRSRNDVSE